MQSALKDNIIYSSMLFKAQADENEEMKQTTKTKPALQCCFISNTVMQFQYPVKYYYRYIRLSMAEPLWLLVRDYIKVKHLLHLWHKEENNLEI